MSELVFGPHATSLNVFSIHIPLVSTSVYLADGGGVPQNLSITGTGPLGQTANCVVANGAQMTVTGIGNLNVQYTINDCTQVAATATAPAHFTFTISLRAVGSISVKLFPIPINLQVDSFSVIIANDQAVHKEVVNTPSPAR